MTPEELWVWLAEDWGFCGCGSPEEAARALEVILWTCRFDGDDDDWALRMDVRRQVLGSVGVEMLMLYRLDDLGLTEHGGSVGGSWLEEKGIAVYEALGRARNVDDFESLFEQRCAHGRTFDEWCYECNPPGPR